MCSLIVIKFLIEIGVKTIVSQLLKSDFDVIILIHSKFSKQAAFCISRNTKLPNLQASGDIVTVGKVINLEYGVLESWKCHSRNFFLKFCRTLSLASLLITLNFWKYYYMPQASSAWIQRSGLKFCQFPRRNIWEWLKFLSFSLKVCKLQPSRASIWILHKLSFLINPT